MRKLLYVPILLWIISCQQKDHASDTPNILLILADDMGYSDLGCFGGEIHTPNLDRLAGQGVRFTQFYNTARCSPTRASLLAGLYPHEAGVGHLTGASAGPGYLGYLNDSTVTIAEVLQQQGYFTGMVGKWHAGNVKHGWPENRGFQEFFGIHNYVDSYFKVLEDCEIFENGKIVIPEKESPMLGAQAGREWYTTDVFTNKAIAFIDKAVENRKPFFQYVAYNAPHWPLEAHDEVIEKYLQAYNGGYEQLRKEKYERMIRMGLISDKWSLPVSDMPDWDTLDDSVKSDTQFRRAIYAAQVEIMDRNIGRLIEHLENKGILQNTMIIFLSDNGCSAEPEDRLFGYQWGKNTRWNYNEWRKNSARQGASQGMVWAIASNSPFQKYKKFTYEGGISTPLIIHWPEGIKHPGAVIDNPGHVVDIMATCVELTGASYPHQRNGIPVKKPRGVSLLKALAGEKPVKHQAIFWEHEGHGALRTGDWKLVSSTAYDENSWELYNMRDDRTETHDLSALYPETRKEMIATWMEMARSTKVLPWPDWKSARKIPVEKE